MSRTSLLPARTRRRLVALSGASMLAAVLGPLAPADASAPSPAAATTVTASGAFAGGPANVTGFGTWRGTSVGIAHAYLLKNTWADIEIPPTWAANWGKSPHASRLLLSMPMLPNDTSTTLQTGATGAYNSHFQVAANRLVAAGLGNAIIRIGWEFNQKWPRWSAVTAPAAYAAYFQQIVTTMRSVPGQSFRFTWCPASAYANWDPTPAYPGDAYVDIVSVDGYNAWWNHPLASPQQRWTNTVTGSKQGGLTYWAAFAASHGKPIALSEWGLTNRDPGVMAGGGGGDDPFYIQSMHDWIATHDVAYESYMETDAPDGKHKMQGTNFPNAAALYRQLW